MALRLGGYGPDINIGGQTIKPDADGYYKLRAGALNTVNNSGIFYRVTEDVMSLFTKNSMAIKKIRHKRLYGEMNHPEPTEAMKLQMKREGNQNAFLKRQLAIEPSNLTHHIRSFELFETNEVDRMTGLKKIIVYVEIKPYGPHKQMVIDALNDKDMAFSLSMRSMVLEQKVNGRVERRIVSLITWDFVITPGIKGSSDQGTMGFEFDETDLLSLKQLVKADFDATGNEADEECSEEVGSLLSCLSCAELKKSTEVNLNDW